jgi:hypothetical protein
MACSPGTKVGYGLRVYCLLSRSVRTRILPCWAFRNMRSFSHSSFVSLQCSRACTVTHASPRMLYYSTIRIAVKDVVPALKPKARRFNLVEQRSRVARTWPALLKYDISASIFAEESWCFFLTFAVGVCVLLLQDLLQSCARGGRRRVEDMCYERRRAEACVVGHSVLLL